MTTPLQQLQHCWMALTPQNQLSVLAFAEFLQARQPVSSVSPPAADISTPAMAVTTSAQPLPIPRPEQEGVIAAVKRLSATYPMLNKNAMLNDTSELVGQHVMSKRDAAEVITELEAVFQQAYRQWCIDNNLSGPL